MALSLPLGLAGVHEAWEVTNLNVFGDELGFTSVGTPFEPRKALNKKNKQTGCWLKSCWSATNRSLNLYELINVWHPCKLENGRKETDFWMGR